MTYQNLRALLIKRFHLPKERSIERAIRRLTLAEKSVFYFFTALFIFSSAALLYKVNSAYLTEVPLRGGTLVEGVIGNPRFINPVLAISEADRNLVSLVYSGLMRYGKEGELLNDLAESVTISPDGLTYTAKLRPEAHFQDGEPVTADDVIFTVQKILDPGIKSPLYGDFAGVTVQKVDAETVTFTLKRPYAPFMNNLTAGILPKHIWSTLTDDEFSFSQWNVLPVGSGPYKVSTVTRDNGGIPNYYELSPFDEAVGGAPYVNRYIFKFYPSDADLLDAFDSGDIDTISGISPSEAESLRRSGVSILTAPLPRVFGVFFNQSENKALLDKAVRQALDMTAPKQEIIDKVLYGYGTAIDGPLPPGLFSSIDNVSQNQDMQKNAEAALALLEKSGWQKNPDTGILEKKSKSATLRMSFNLSTSDNPELKAVADILKSAWNKLGAEVTVSVYEPGDLNQNVIRPRRYEALLFGEVVGRDADVFPFWHSSERNDPGLNIALYANSQTDKLLSDARSQSDTEKREALYKSFNTAVKADVPAVFLYTPSFIYVVPKTLKGLTLGELATPQDRFLDARNWYIETNSVWNIFAQNN
jgi:peptide/nickel transport system substrate-binding protein